MKKKTVTSETEEITIDNKRQKRKREKKAYREIRWDRLDNTAHLFPVIAGENMSNVYRISVTLTELVQPDILQQALNIVLPKMDGFNLRLRMGVFWYYFEENGKSAPKVREESNFPCRYIQQNQNHSYMFRVTYYKYRINLEVFHVLTDGMGGINFLKELTYQYLRLAHPEAQITSRADGHQVVHDAAAGGLCSVGGVEAHSSTQLQLGPRLHCADQSAHGLFRVLVLHDAGTGPLGEDPRPREAGDH